MRLYHLTCTHAARQITKYGLIMAFPQPTLGGVKLAWFTDSPELPKDALGLTSFTLPCDRRDPKWSQHA